MSDNKDKTKGIAKNEDVEFSRELADQDDMEAIERMEKADKRAQNKNNNQ
ncbi:hypothetical protein GCM10011351_28870 [Paraliobacillus quinghaiensis]|uniref:YfhD family protein n=1 Tax=Paraliobacillus quinghaiensis TaxID=470815 RepID=A0A917WYK0_9BACI|nr:YfhD family protein [Paraliobacillus quinghaiensis]GGM40876.1 hypothetical protein GCM10011351_28870 [Paraliobacillus quinghaiensis]